MDDDWGYPYFRKQSYQPTVFFVVKDGQSLELKPLMTWSMTWGPPVSRHPKVMGYEPINLHQSTIAWFNGVN